MVMDPDKTKKDRDNILRAFGLDPENVFGRNRESDLDYKSVLEEYLPDTGTQHEQERGYV